MFNTKVSDLMTDHPVLISSESSLREAAQKMEEVDCGALPVSVDGEVQGIITDRDIVIRAIAKGNDPSKELVKDYMTTRVFACNEDDLLEDAARKMHDFKVSRLVVRNHAGEVTGILSFGGILRKNAAPNEVSNLVKHAIHHSPL